MDSIYKQVRANQEILQEGAQYESSDLFAEREALYQQMREQGYFDYVRQYMRVGLDTLVLHRHTDLHIQVSNPDSVHRHQVYHIDSVYFTIEAAEGVGKEKSTRQFDPFTKINYLDQTDKFRLRPLARYAFLRSEERFDSKNEELSYDSIIRNEWVSVCENQLSKEGFRKA